MLDRLGRPTRPAHRLSAATSYVSSPPAAHGSPASPTAAFCPALATVRNGPIPRQPSCCRGAERAPAEDSAIVFHRRRLAGAGCRRSVPSCAAQLGTAGAGQGAAQHRLSAASRTDARRRLLLAHRVSSLGVRKRADAPSTSTPHASAVARAVADSHRTRYAPTSQRRRPAVSYWSSPTSARNTRRFTNGR